MAGQLFIVALSRVGVGERLSIMLIPGSEIHHRMTEVHGLSV